jgi:hypothetical protein
VRLRRGSPTKDLEFDLDIPDEVDVHRGFAGNDLVVSAGDPLDPRATTISIGAVRDGDPVTLDEHVARVRANVAKIGSHLVDEAPVELAGEAAWWTVEAAVSGGCSVVVDRWMLVRDGVGWTVTAQMPWDRLHQLRDGVHAVISTLRFR